MKGPVMIFNGMYCIPHAAQHGECPSLTFNTFFLSYLSKKNTGFLCSVWDIGGSVHRFATKRPQALHCCNSAGLRTCLDFCRLELFVVLIAV